MIQKKLLKLRGFSCMIGKVLIEKPFGGVAQLGERYTGSVEVMGSNPTVSTILKALKLDFRAFSFCVSFRIVDFTDVLPTNMLRRKKENKYLANNSI